MGLEPCSDGHIPVSVVMLSKPTITDALVCRAKYQPYDALRQRLWFQLLKQYDTDDTRTITQLELTSMLD